MMNRKKVRGILLKEVSTSRPTILKRYTLGEEIFNSVSHGVGSLLAVIGTTILVTVSVLYGNREAVIVSLIYGLSLIMLYTMSTLYHAFSSEKVKHIFRIFDHSTIFLLIAGSYTPFLMILLGDEPIARITCYVLWGISILGIVLNSINLDRFSKLSLVLYLVMGWAILLFLPSVVSSLPRAGFWLLLLGGISYTGGVAFFLMPKVRYMHSVWHLFVLAGSVLHYLCILLYVIPLTFVG